MYRQNAPFTWHPVYAPSDIVGYYVRANGVHRTFDTAEEMAMSLYRNPPAGFYERGILPREGAEPTYWTVDAAFRLAPRTDPRTGRIALEPLR